MDLIYNHFYVISLEHPYLNHCPPELAKKYTKNIIVQFKGWYYENATEKKQGIMFHHNVLDFCGAMMTLSHVCPNYVIDDDDECYWESHIFRERFIVHRDITSIVLRACCKFKRLLKNNLPN